VTFLYREIYGIDYGGKGGVSRAKPPSVLPKYAAPEEVDQVLARLQGSSRVAAMIMYGAGTRVSETVNLRIKDLSLASGELVVRAGEGMKDRTTVIPRGAVPEIRTQIQRVEELHVRDLEAGAGWAPLPAALHRKDPHAGWDLGWQYLFPASTLTLDPKTRRRGRRPLHVTVIQRAVKRAVRESGVPRPITCHVFRHCFATEMLRSGCDIRLLQRLMGHRDLKTTSRYLHIINRPGLNVISPLDRLPSFREDQGT
jgi:site-specific recombinase XerD